MWPFTCSVCREKDARIADLKEVIANQKQQLNPPPRVNTYELEENYLLQGANDEQVEPVSEEISKQKAEQLRAIEEERERMLTGSTWEQ